MKLLIITQVVDKEHPILGFFHRWLEEFAKHVETLHVICLEEGTHTLPAHVHVHSLGKEKGKGRLAYVLEFYRLIFSLRHDYDRVFVHMNQEYILLGGLFWRVLSKRVMMWRNHYSGNVLTDIAGRLCHNVFYTSSSSYTQKFKNAEQMPIGIDPETFKDTHTERKKDSLLFVGRIATSKKIDVILDSLPDILQAKQNTTLTVVGPVGDEEYLKNLKQITLDKNLPVTFVGPISWFNLPEMYSSHELCINMSAPGMFDKVIGEALLCGCDILTTNKDLDYLLDDRIIADSPQDISKFVSTYNYNGKVVGRLREGIIQKHSLPALIKKVLTVHV